MEKKFTFSDLLSNAYQIGIKNILSLIGALILWVLTIWIPYINVGTTIAIVTIPASLSRGNVISPLEIFNKKYLKYMGDFFLVVSLRNIGVFVAFLFMIIPGIVLSLAWSLAVLLVVDKGMNANKALNVSNKLTYGYKWIIFGAQIVLFLPVIILGWITPVLSTIYLLLLGPCMLGLTAYVYGQLASDIPEEV
ncbi:MAG: hypothetical protein R6U85_05255 [Salinivirgaceae bacterium]